MTQARELVVRPADGSDAPALYATHRASFLTLCATHYPEDVLQGMFASKTLEGYFPALDRGEMFVCEAAGAIIGFGHALPGVVEAIFVHPDFAGRGVGSCLLKDALRRAWRTPADSVTLFATLNAQPFYAKHGFREVRRCVISRGGIDFAVVEMVLPGEAPR